MQAVSQGGGTAGNIPAVRALVFDVFGTVVDWRGSILRECRALGRSKRISADWDAFTDAWRAGYRPAMARVRSGETKVCTMPIRKTMPVSNSSTLGVS